MACVRCHVVLLLGDGFEQGIVGLLLRGRGQAAISRHRFALTWRTTPTTEAWRTAVVGSVLVLGQIGVQAAGLSLVVRQHVLRLDQFIDRAAGLIPNVGRRSGRVLQLIFILLQLGRVLLHLLGILLNLLERLRNALNSRQHVLGQVAPIDHGNTCIGQLTA